MLECGVYTHVYCGSRCLNNGVDEKSTFLWLSEPQTGAFPTDPGRFFHPLIVENSSPEIRTWCFSQHPKIARRRPPGLIHTEGSHFLFFFLLSPSFCRLRFLQRNRRLMLPIHSFVCLLTFSLSLPVAISLFPQMSEVQSGITLTASAAASRPDGPASSCRTHTFSYCYTTSNAPTESKFESSSCSTCLLWCLIKNPRSLRLIEFFTFLFSFFFPDWSFSPRAWDRLGNRLQVGDLQQGFMIDVCTEEEEHRRQEGEATVGNSFHNHTWEQDQEGFIFFHFLSRYFFLCSFSVFVSVTWFYFLGNIFLLVSKNDICGVLGTEVSLLLSFDHIGEDSHLKLLQFSKMFPHIHPYMLICMC